MRILIIFLLIYPSFIVGITFEDLDYIRSLSDKDSKSIILNGTKFCNNYFSRKALFLNKNKEIKNIFLCKFSKKRNRFYVYMLSVQKKDNKPLKKFCNEILNNWPNISNHMNSKFSYQNREYLDGFYVENFYYDKILSFSNNYKNDQQLIKNEIDNFLLKNRKNFSENNQLNNEILQKEIVKIEKIYNKIISNKSSNLDSIINQQLEKIVRYKIFVNDVQNFKSYSCNWKPGNGEIPYVKREKYSEFEDI